MFAWEMPERFASAEKFEFQINMTNDRTSPQKHINYFLKLRFSPVFCARCPLHAELDSCVVGFTRNLWHESRSLRVAAVLAGLKLH